MIEFGGVTYYLDINALDKAICPDKNNKKKIVDIEKTTVTNEKGDVVGVETTEKTYSNGNEINGAKYDILRMCIETLIDYDDETDDTLGSDRALSKTPLSYKLAFNTLLNEGILKEKE